MMTASTDLHLEHTPALRMIRILEVLGVRMEHGVLPEPGDLGKAVEFLQVFVDRCHHGKEEQLLFPALMSEGDLELRELVQQLLRDHQQARGHVKVLAEAAEAGDTDRLRQTITAYATLIRPHILTEEKRVFPAADHLLPREVQERLEDGYARIEEEVVGAGRHEQLRSTLRELKERYGVR